MIIVIEYVLLDNFLIDALLLYLVYKILKQPINRWGIVLASLFGAGFAVVSPLIEVSGILAIAIKLSVALVMCFMSSFSFKKILSRYALFILYTFAFGGALIALFSFMGVQVYETMYVGYVSSLPLGTILIAAFFFAALSLKLIKILFYKYIKNSVTCVFNVICCGKKAKLRGFVDTGNLLVNNQGKPVIVMAENELRHWLTPYERMSLMLGKTDNLKLKNLQSITVNSLGGGYKMFVFDAQIELKKGLLEVSIGVTNSRIKGGDCQAIIGEQIMEVLQC